MVRVGVLLLASLFYCLFHPELAIAQNAAPPEPKAVQPAAKRVPQGAGSPVTGATADELLKGQTKVDANAGTVTIMTNRVLGGAIMTSALDLSTLLDDGERFEKMRVIPMIARGKMQNLWDILYLRGVDMGFLQSDTLEYLKDDPQIKSIKDKIRYIAVMFPEEIHIIARSDINSLEDLAGKKISINAKGTGSSVTGPVIFRRLGINATLEYEESNIALERMRKGDLAAHVYVLAKPAQPVAQIKAEGLHMLPIPFTPFVDLYLPSKFTSKDYPNLIPPDQEVQTLAVGNLLAVFNWPESSERYKKVARFTDAFFSRFSELRKPGLLAAWKDINLGAKVSGWTRFKAAQDWLDRYNQDPAVREKFEAFLKKEGMAGNPDSRNEDKMYQQFLEWRSRIPK
jgi:uncharacterized protein